MSKKFKPRRRPRGALRRVFYRMALNLGLMVILLGMLAGIGRILAIFGFHQVSDWFSWVGDYAAIPLVKVGIGYPLLVGGADGPTLGVFGVIVVLLLPGSILFSLGRRSRNQ